MEIEYAYNFKENLFYAGWGALRFYLWFIPVYFAFRFIKVRASFLNLALMLISSLSLLYWEYDSLNNKFVKLAYQHDRVTLIKKNGELIAIQPNSIDRFWSISVGRGGGWLCYLLVKTETQDYASLVVRKHDHSCKLDAENLNTFYYKS